MTGFEPTTSWSRRKLDRVELSPDLAIFSTIILNLTLVLTLVGFKKSQLIECCSLYQIPGCFELNCSIFLVELIWWSWSSHIPPIHMVLDQLIKIR